MKPKDVKKRRGMKRLMLFEKDKDRYRLDLFAYTLTRKEFSEAKKDVANLGSELRTKSIDGHFFYAELHDQYERLIEIIKALESKGWHWAETEGKDK